MMADDDQITCDVHGSASPAFVCAHLAANPVQRWHCDDPTDENPWPDAWCDRCNDVYLRDGEWNDDNSREIELKILCHRCYEDARSASVDCLDDARRHAWRAFVDLCHGELQIKQDQLIARYALGKHSRWDWDQARGELVFSSGGIPAVIAKIQFVGSISTRSNTWLWSWANPRVMASVRDGMIAVRDFGRENDYPHLVVPKWSADEADGWEMAAIALHVLDAPGVYRSPGDNGVTFLVMTDIRLAQ